MHLLLATLVAGVALLAVSTFGLLDAANAERQPLGRVSVSVTPQWSQETGSGLFVPACGSSGANTSCQGGTTIVNFNWTIDGPVPPAPGFTCNTAAIKVNGSTIASSLPCSGSYQWNGASPNTNYNYEIIVSTP